MHLMVPYSAHYLTLLICLQCSDLYLQQFFSAFNVDLNENAPPVKIQLLNLLKGHHIITEKWAPTGLGLDKLRSCNALWIKGHNMVNKSLNYVIISTALMSVKFCNNFCYIRPNLLAPSIYRIHVYFHIWIILHHLGIPIWFAMIVALMRIKYG